MRRRWVAAVLILTCVWWLGLALVPIPRAGGSAATFTVGVVEFYAPTPLGSYPGVVPESFAADDLSGLLARSATGQVTVIPADAMRRAEGDLRWRTADALHFDRLRDLAKAVGANRLVVGWIPLFSVDWGGDPTSDGGRGPIVAEASVVVQVFDAGAGRLVGETRQFGSAVGITSWQVVTGALHGALERSLPGLLRVLGAGGS